MAGEEHGRWFERCAIGWCACMAVAAAAFSGWAWQDTRVLRQEVGGLERRIEQGMVELSGLRSRTRELVVMQQATAPVVGLLEPTHRAYGLLDELRDAAARLSLHDVRLTAGEADAYGDYVVTPVRVEAVGDARSVIEWVRQMEGRRPTVRVDYLDLQAAGERDGSTELRVTAELRLHLMAEAGEPGTHRLSDGGSGGRGR